MAEIHLTYSPTAAAVGGINNSLLVGNVAPSVVNEPDDNVPSDPSGAAPSAPPVGSSTVAPPTPSSASFASSAVSRSKGITVNTPGGGTEILITDGVQVITPPLQYTNQATGTQVSQLNVRDAMGNKIVNPA